MLGRHLSAPLSDEPMKRRRIDEFTTKLFDALEKATEESTPWAKPHEIAKYEWSKDCTQAIKEARRLRRQCRTPID